MVFKITLRENFNFDNLLKRIEEANVVLPFSSFLWKDAFGNLYNKKNFVIKCEGQEFHFNKTLLCLVSDTFTRMIQGKLGNTAKSGYVELLSRRLFLKTRTLKKELPQLTCWCLQKCIKYLTSNLNPDKVHDVIKNAELIREENLKTMFLSKNKKVESKWS